MTRFSSSPSFFLEVTTCFISYIAVFEEIRRTRATTARRRARCCCAWRGTRRGRSARRPRPVGQQLRGMFAKRRKTEVKTTVFVQKNGVKTGLSSKMFGWFFYDVQDL